MSEKVIVTILCICYNHARYLHQALDSVLSQKTDFEYEIIIHDDASTDGSQEIICEYKSKFPSCIRTILQTENQYSQGKLITDIVSEMICGNYVVYLECDDFWQDEYKLQKQVDAMRTHPECVMCVHRTELYNEDGSKRHEFVPRISLSEGVLPQSDLVDYIANTAQFHTTSRLIRTEYYRKMLKAPYVNCCKIVGDLPAILYLSQQGPFYYLSEAMTGYRMSSKGSYTERLLTDTHFFCAVRTEMRNMWCLFAKHHPQYQKIAQQQVEMYCKQEIMSRLSTGLLEQYRLVHCEPYYQYYKKLSLSEKAKGWLRIYFPQLFQILKSIKVWVKHEE